MHDTEFNQILCYAFNIKENTQREIIMIIMMMTMMMIMILSLGAAERNVQRTLSGSHYVPTVVFCIST